MLFNIVNSEHKGSPSIGSKQDMCTFVSIAAKLILSSG